MKKAMALRVDPRSHREARRSASARLPEKRFGVVDRAARGAVLRALAGLRHGRLLLEDSLGSVELGDGVGPTVELRVLDPHFYRSVLSGGSNGFASAWIRGQVTSHDLVALLRHFVRNVDAADRLERGAARIGMWISRVAHALRRNSRGGSARNIRAHYDLGNDFYSLFLDETMTYSCGIFEEKASTLAEASTAKYDRVCRKLRLGPDDHVVEIGCGWGGFAIHAASRYGCRVTGTTISDEQHEWARRRVREEKLDGRVEIVKKDYRDLEGTWGKLVSIEMIEAVGHRFLPTYFETCSRLLARDGVGVVQAITMPGHRYEQYTKSVDFIREYIFPGSCVPSLAAMANAMAERSDLEVLHVEDFGPHYATTLRKWRERFEEREAAVRRLGFDDAFVRLWTYYLCYCEAGFEERYTGVIQMVMARPGYRGAPILGPKIEG
jgi:cyclopropane-fatty-acyl-phospholipid synthase